jgi:hypothetical protein
VENGLPIKRSEIEGILNPLHENLRVARFSGLLIGLSLLSYQVRELLVCWLFFILPLVMLGLLIFGGVVACDAGRYFIHWAGTATRVPPVAGLEPIAVNLKTVVSNIKPE